MFGLFQHWVTSRDGRDSGSPGACAHALGKPLELHVRRVSIFAPTTPSQSRRQPHFVMETHDVQLERNPIWHHMASSHSISQYLDMYFVALVFSSKSMIAQLNQHIPNSLCTSPHLKSSKAARHHRFRKSQTSPSYIMTQPVEPPPQLHVFLHPEIGYTGVAKLSSISSSLLE